MDVTNLGKASEPDKGKLRVGSGRGAPGSTEGAGGEREGGKGGGGGVWAEAAWRRAERKRGAGLEIQGPGVAVSVARRQGRCRGWLCSGGSESRDGLPTGNDRAAGALRWRKRTLGVSQHCLRHRIDRQGRRRSAKPGVREPPNNRKENGEDRGRVGATCRHRSAAAWSLRRAATAPRPRPPPLSAVPPPLGPALRPSLPPRPCGRGAAQRSAGAAGSAGHSAPQPSRESRRAGSTEVGPAGLARSFPCRSGSPAAPPQPLSPAAERSGPGPAPGSCQRGAAPPRRGLASPRPGAAAPRRDRRRRRALCVLFWSLPSRGADRAREGAAARAGRGGRALRALCCGAVPAGAGPGGHRAASRRRLRDGPALRRRENGCGGKHGRLRRAP